MADYYELPTLANVDLPVGKRVRLRRLLYEHGPANGTLMVLPIDQGLEHGPMDFFENPDSKFPLFQYELAKQGNFSAIALQFGLAAKYLKNYAGEVPLILKINGKTSIPPDDEAFSPLTASVEDAVRLGADAVGYTLYVGSPAQADDIAQLKEVREDCDYYGMPLIVWAYPRGTAVEGKGGRDSYYAIDYAARVTAEMGGDIVKVNYPKINPDKDAKAPKPYRELKVTADEAFKQVVKSAGRTMVLVSGGSKEGDEALLNKARLSMEAGATGLIFGRNLWQRKMDDALKIAAEIHKIMAKFPRKL